MKKNNDIKYTSSKDKSSNKVAGKVFRVALNSAEAKSILSSMDTLDKVKIQERVKKYGEYEFKINGGRMVTLFSNGMEK